MIRQPQYLLGTVTIPAIVCWNTVEKLIANQFVSDNQTQHAVHWWTTRKEGTVPGTVPGTQGALAHLVVLMLFHDIYCSRNNLRGYWVHSLPRRPPMNSLLTQHDHVSWIVQYDTLDPLHASMSAHYHTLRSITMPFHGQKTRLYLHIFIISWHSRMFVVVCGINRVKLCGACAFTNKNCQCYSVWNSINFCVSVISRYNSIKFRFWGDVFLACR